jgi:16S rRNA G1207 methylase RsmC
LVMLNPPFSVGKATCHKLITQWYEHLAPGWSLWLVAPTARWAKTYIARCQEQFGLNAVIVCMVQKGYRVWRVEKK